MRMQWLMVALIGCYRPTPPAGAPCNALNDCPSPLVCDQGICQDEALAGDAPGDTLVDGWTDAMADGATGCAPPPSLGTFSPPAVSTLSTGVFDGAPTVSADGLELYFESARMGGAGGLDIWRSTRAALGASWEAPTPVTEINLSSQDTSPELSNDGLALWFSSTRAGGLGGADIWRSTRASPTSPWTAPDHVPGLSSAALDEGVLMMPSTLVAYLHSQRDGIPRIYRSTRPTTNSGWSTPVVVESLPPFAENPWLTDDECTIYFARYTIEADAPDIVVATRSTPTGAFGTPVVVSAINDPATDTDPWLSADQRTILFSSNREGGGSGSVEFDILEATR